MDAKGAFGPFIIRLLSGMLPPELPYDYLPVTLNLCISRSETSVLKGRRFDGDPSGDASASSNLNYGLDMEEYLCCCLRPPSSTLSFSAVNYGISIPGASPRVLILGSNMPDFDLAAESLS